MTSWQALDFEQHDMFAAFRVRFSEFQEHMGKTMRAVAIEEEVPVERFGSVLAFMEKIGVLESVERWKLLRELRNAINHEYEEDTTRLEASPTKMLCLRRSRRRTTAFCGTLNAFGAPAVPVTRSATTRSLHEALR